MGITIGDDILCCGHATFIQLKEALAKAANLVYDYENDLLDEKMEEVFTDDHLAGKWETDPVDPLYILLLHHHEEGVILKKHLIPLAKRLEKLLPLMEPHKDSPSPWKVQEARLER